MENVLATPSSLISMSLRCRDFEKTDQIISFFNLEDKEQHIVETVSFCHYIYNLEGKLSESEKLSFSIEDLLEDCGSELQALNILMDLAVCLSKNSMQSRELLQRAKEQLEKMKKTEGIEVYETVVAVCEALIEKNNLADFFSSDLNDSPLDPNVLMEKLSKSSVFNEKLEKLKEAQRKKNGNAKLFKEAAQTFLEEKQEWGGVEDTLEFPMRGDYLGAFLDYITNLASILRNTSSAQKNYFGYLSNGVGAIISDLIFRQKQCKQKKSRYLLSLSHKQKTVKKAEDVAFLLKGNLISRIIDCLSKLNKSR